MLVFKYFSLILAKILLKLIRLYQRTISPDTGWFRALNPYGFCRFEPHCSEYGYRAIAKYGPFLGSYKALARIIRCHPWAGGGHDPLV
ncbi:MAG: membrane protein insertion efficiency factor YidD [Patescibacteria group bacterium]